MSKSQKSKAKSKNEAKIELKLQRPTYLIYASKLKWSDIQYTLWWSVLQSFKVQSLILISIILNYYYSCKVQIILTYFVKTFIVCSISIKMAKYQGKVYLGYEEEIIVEKNQTQLNYTINKIGGYPVRKYNECF